MKSKGDRYRKFQSWVDNAQPNDELSRLVEKYMCAIYFATTEREVEIFNFTYLRMSTRELCESTFIHDWKRLYWNTSYEINKLEQLDNNISADYAILTETEETED